MPRPPLKTRNDLVKYVENHPIYPRIARAIVEGETELLGGFDEIYGHGPGWILEIRSKAKKIYRVAVILVDNIIVITRIVEIVPWEHWCGKIDRSEYSIYDGDNPKVYQEMKDASKT